MNISRGSRVRAGVMDETPADGWRLADMLRLLGVLGVPVAYLVSGIAAAAAISLVWGGQMAVRALVRAGVADWALQTLFLLSGWFAVLGVYQQVAWLDIPMHVLSTPAAAWLTWTLLVRGGALPGRAGTRAERVGLVVVVTALGALASVLWELGEWFGFSFFTRRVGVGYDDTIGDVFCGALGSLGLGLLLARGRPRTDPPDPA